MDPPLLCLGPVAMLACPGIIAERTERAWVCGGVSGSPESGFPETSCDNRYGSRVVHLLWCPGDLGLNPNTGCGCSQVVDKASSTESGA